MAEVEVPLIPVEVRVTTTVEEETEVVEQTAIVVAAADQIALTTTDEIETATVTLADLVNLTDTQTVNPRFPTNHTPAASLSDE
jgi:hypothetical protein